MSNLFIGPWIFCSGLQPCYLAQLEGDKPPPGQVQDHFSQHKPPSWPFEKRESSPSSHFFFEKISGPFDKIQPIPRGIFS